MLAKGVLGSHWLLLFKEQYLDAILQAVAVLFGEKDW